jgi:hypothetical protein
MRVCALPDCDEPIVQRGDEKPREFAKRRCCCTAHGYKLRSILLRGNQNGVVITPWPCVACGQLHNRRTGRSRRLRTCSDKCEMAARFRGPVKGGQACTAPKRRCPVCATEHDRRAPGGHGRTKLPTCSEECARVAEERARAQPRPRPRGANVEAPMEWLDRPRPSMAHLLDEPPPVWRFSGGAHG